MDNELISEQARLDDVVVEIEQQIVAANEAHAAAHSETRAVEGNYAANTSINTLEVDDAMETNAEIQQQRNIVARVNETEAIARQKVATLTTLRQAPYFGRIDIDEAGDQDTLYIGLASLQDDQGEFLIYDWRAPISGIYYNGTLGDVTYPTPIGEMHAELLKKRQYTIANDQIVNMFDTNETVGDELLQYALGQQNDTTMRNIVATIQQEQNAIIRDTKSDLLVVQGVAGSGKTSAILQRIAFLLFHARENLNSDQIVLFSPNRLFSSYIADVLPSLGERNMRQVTLAEFISARLEGLTVQTLFDRYEQGQTDALQAALLIRAKLEDATIMQRLLAYRDTLTVSDIAFDNIYYQNQTYFTASEIQTIFAGFSTQFSIKERLQMTQKALQKQLAKRIGASLDLDWVQEGLDNLTDLEFQALLGSDYEEDLADEENMNDLLQSAAHKYVARELQAVDDAIYNNHYFDIYRQYADFLQWLGRQDAELADLWQAKRDRFMWALELHQIDLEDAVPLMYLRDLMTNGGTNSQMMYVFVDEMQDYSMAQLLYLKHAFPMAKFTVLGDAEQALFRPVEAPTVLLQKYSEAFTAKRPNMVILNKAYRSTQEIMNFAKALLPDGDQIIAFTRHGALPQMVLSDPKKIGQDLQGIVHQLHEQYGTVAVLTKTQAQAEVAMRHLRSSKLAVQLLHANDRKRTAPILVMPIYLAKGLEFDAVIGFDVSQTNYPDHLATGLLYTLASRAMHALVLISVDGTLPRLIEAVAETVQIVESPAILTWTSLGKPVQW